MGIEHEIKEGTYDPCCELSFREHAWLSEDVEKSEEFELGYLGHVLLKGSNRAIGYLGEGNIGFEFSLIDRHDESLRGHHANLLGMVYDCVEQ